MLASTETPMIAAEEAKNALIGLARDIRGLAFAFNTKASYMMFFDWVYPNYTAILLHAMELWYHDPQVRLLSFYLNLEINGKANTAAIVSILNCDLFLEHYAI